MPTLKTCPLRFMKKVSYFSFLLQRLNISYNKTFAWKFATLNFIKIHQKYQRGGHRSQNRALLLPNEPKITEMKQNTIVNLTRSQSVFE